MLKPRIAYAFLLLAACNEAIAPPPGGDPGGLGVGLIEIQPAPLIVMPGDSIQLHAIVRAANGDIIPNAPIRWTSSNAGLRVTSSGKAIAEFGGTATVTATSDNVSASATIDVCGWPNYFVGKRFFQIGTGGSFFEGHLDQVMTLFGGGVMYGTNAGDLVIGRSYSGTVSHLANGTTCRLSLPDGDYARSLLVLREFLASPPNSPVQAVEEVFAPRTRIADRLILIRYTFTNITATQLKGFRAGLWLDWDLAFNQFGGNDNARLNPSTGAAETFESTGEVGGVAAVDAPITSYLGVTSSTGPRTVADHFNVLAGPVRSQVVGPGDVAQFVGYGPFDIPAGGTLTLTFVLTAARTRAEFDTNIAVGRGIAELFPVVP